MRTGKLTWRTASVFAAAVLLLASSPLLLAGSPLRAQSPGPLRPMGSVSAADADVTNGPAGTLRVAGDRVQLVGSSTVTARDHTAAIGLTRGGTISVCRSSALHLTQSAVSGAIPPLLLALDRGAIEVNMPSLPGDAILTPDMRLAAPGGGQLELRLHVAASGDTCVDNVGNAGPVVNITDAFGETSYQVKPGQHVLFEHGDLHAVVDRETTPCGCPAAERHGVSVAEALMASHGTMTPAGARAVNPFPAAESSGLAPNSPPPPEAGGTHVQVATTLSYDPSAPLPPVTEDAGVDQTPATRLAAPDRPAERRPAPTTAGTALLPLPPPSSGPAAPVGEPASISPVHPPVQAPAAVPATVAEQRKPEPQPHPFRAIGHFFKHLFVR